MPPTSDVPLEELYRTSVLLDGFVQIPPAAVFLRDRLFGRVQTTEADLVSIEFYRGRQKLAPFCSRYSKGTAVAREKTQLSLFAPPFCKPNRMLHADDLLRRNIGGSRNGGTATNKDAELLLLDEQELDASISRTENWMCSQVLFSGKVVCKDGDSGEPVSEIDYGPISRTVTTKPWSDSTADPLADLKAAQRLVSGACGFSADLIVMGKDAGDAFESNAKVLESYNKVHIQPGVLTAEIAQYGVVSLGTWRGLTLYVSEEQYEDTDGTMKYYVPPKEVLVASTGIQSTMAYAGVAQGDNDGKGMSVYEGRRVPLHLLGHQRRGLPQAKAFEPPDPDPGKHRLVDGPASARLTLNFLKLMANSTHELPQNLGDLMGAYDQAHWQTQVSEIKAGIGVLLRGTILASGTGADIGKLCPWLRPRRPIVMACSSIRRSTPPSRLPMAR